MLYKIVHEACLEYFGIQDVGPFYVGILGYFNFGIWDIYTLISGYGTLS